MEIPDDWMAITWETTVKAEPTPGETAAEGMVAHFSKMMPEGVKMPDLLGMMPSQIAKTRYEAFICPEHASNLPLRAFHKIGTRRLMPGES